MGNFNRRTVAMNLILYMYMYVYVYMYMYTYTLVYIHEQDILIYYIAVHIVYLCIENQTFYPRR